MRQSVDLQVAVPPEPVRTAAGTQLIYELHVTNFAPVEIRLTGLAVLDAGAGGRAIREFHDAELAALIGHPGLPSDVGKTSVAPGARVVVYLRFNLNGARVPLVLSHRVEFDLVEPSVRERMIVQGAAVPVNMQRPVALGPPLRGGPWVASYDPGKDQVRAYWRAVPKPAYG